MSTVDERLAYERRVRPRQAIIAGVAGLLLFASVIAQAVGSRPKVDELTVQLISISKHQAVQIIAPLLAGLGVIAFALTLSFLFGAARARKKEQLPGVQIGAVAGGVLAAASGIAYGIFIAIKAHHFVTHGDQTYQQAHALLSGGALVAVQYVGLLGTLLLSMAFVLVSLNAMRVGLLTRFMGYLGIGAAAASVFLIGSPIPLVLEIFWLFSVAYLLLGRWPSGDPPAWNSGREEKWPSSQELRAQRAETAKAARAGRAARGGRGGKGGGKPAPAPAPSTSRQPVAAPAVAGSEQRGARAGGKRKRKRRK